MGRETSPYIVGDWWLDKRRDGKSPAVWQIATYDAAARTVVYRSTRRKSLDDAKAIIHAHVESERAKGPQTADEAKVLPLLFLYWNEHGKGVVSPGQIASSIRAFMGFVMQDEATPDLTVADLNAALFERFRVWRMAAHRYSVPWGGKTFNHSSAAGVRGETVSRNLDDIRAALGHNAKAERLSYVPVVPQIAEEHRSEPKDIVLTNKQLGAIVGFARGDVEMLQFVLLQLATAVRPEAASAFDPARQWNPETKLIDLHPPGWRRTKKRNPVVPTIAPMVPYLEAWVARGAKPVKSRKTAWRTLRAVLDLPPAIEAKTIRHTVATRLRTAGVPGEEIETLLGHRVMKKTTLVYAKYDPKYLAKACRALAKIFVDIMAESDRWAAVHLRSIGKKGKTVIVRRDDPNAV